MILLFSRHDWELSFWIPNRDLWGKQEAFINIRSDIRHFTYNLCRIITASDIKQTDLFILSKMNCFLFNSILGVLHCINQKYPDFVQFDTCRDNRSILQSKNIHKCFIFKVPFQELCFPPSPCRRRRVFFRPP